jgi:hypothetical protein
MFCLTGRCPYDRVIPFVHIIPCLQLGLCALFMAAEMGDVPTVEVLLSFQPDLSIKEAVGASRLVSLRAVRTLTL